MATPPTPTSGFIKLLNVPFDSDYRHVLDFKNETEKAGYFSSKVLRLRNNDTELSYENCSYSRKDGTLKVPIHIDRLNGVNYLMYKNPFYSNKMYYCFVLGRRYINDNCTELKIKTDVYQTWIHFVKFSPCFVEREHTLSDIPGNNLLPEGLETGEFIPYETTDLNKDLFDPVPCIAFTGNNIGSYTVTQKSKCINGIPTSFSFIIAVNCGVYPSLIDTINIDGNGDKIFCTFTIPKLAVYKEIEFLKNVGRTFGELGETSTHNDSYMEERRTIYTNIKPDRIGDYIPRNKKLLTYPFIYLGFNPPNGSTKIYRFENFKNDTIRFDAICEVNPNPTVVVIPYLYNKLSAINIQESASITGYPTLAYRNDYYNTWLAQNNGAINLAIDKSNFNYEISTLYNENAQKREETSALLNALSSTLGVVTNSMSLNIGGAISGALGGVQGATNSLYTLDDLKLSNISNSRNLQYDLRAIQANKERHQMLPDTGALSSSNATLLGFKLMSDSCFSIYGIKPEQAERIDHYFDMFGYQTNFVKIPNLKGRRSWNYVKTMGCNITGFIPDEDRKELCSIFDNGVTIWHHPATIHNYFMSNEIEV